MKLISGNESRLSTAPWYSYYGKPFDGPFPPFFDNAHWPWLDEWKQNSAKQFPVFRAEIENFLQSHGHSLQPYFNKELVSGKGQWQVGYFYAWGRRDEKNCAACPGLGKWLSSIDGLLSAAVSILPPHTEIRPHMGDTNTVVRCHLGLSVPAGLPACGLNVRDQSRGWTEGEWFCFCDAFEHSSWNRTDQPRYVLIIDVVLPAYASRKNEICRNVRSLLRLQALGEKRKWVKRLPGKIRGLIRRFYTLTA